LISRLTNFLTSKLALRGWSDIYILMGCNVRDVAQRIGVWLAASAC
jgi:hypothetical protein